MTKTLPYTEPIARRIFKKIFLYCCKYLGLFYFGRQVYKNELRILCYHGFTLRDEGCFAPGAFLSPDVFLDRISYLTNKRFRVVRLDRAIEALEQNERLADAVR